MQPRKRLLGGVSFCSKSKKSPKSNQPNVYSFIAVHDYHYLLTKVGERRAKRFVMGLGYASTITYSLVGAGAVTLFEKKRPELKQILQKHGVPASGVPSVRIDENALRSDLINLLGVN
ncbi:Uncharacterised protein [uncultured archaeon]|nr:Uncharacterised protein [uncultured archaeon]